MCSTRTGIWTCLSTDIPTTRAGKTVLLHKASKKNLNLSQERAQSVSSYLLSCGVSTNQIKSVQGMGESDPVASNDTAAGREQNRRVEVYMYASEQMIRDAQAATH